MNGNEESFVVVRRVNRLYRRTLARLRNYYVQEFDLTWSLVCQDISSVFYGGKEIPAETLKMLDKYRLRFEELRRSEDTLLTLRRDRIAGLVLAQTLHNQHWKLEEELAHALSKELQPDDELYKAYTDRKDHRVTSLHRLRRSLRLSVDESKLFFDEVKSAADNRSSSDLGQKEEAAKVYFASVRASLPRPVTNPVHD